MDVQTGEKATWQLSADETTDQESLASKACDALRLATNWAKNQAQPDGHWVGELRTNVTFTAEWIFVCQSVGLDLTDDAEAYRTYFWSEQNPDGSWGLAPSFRGDVSVTTEAYLALKILEVPPNLPAMRRAREFVLAAGGVSKVRMFTRLFLATFGLFPWDATPQLPAELILLPPQFPINIYALASWTRLTLIPQLIIVHHQPIFALPNGKSAENNFLDELWCDANSKLVPYSPSLWNLWKTDAVEFGFTVLDNVLYQVGGLRRIPLLRRYARRRAVDWILNREKDSGGWGAIAPAIQGSILALTLEGYSVDDPLVRRAIKSMEGFSIRDHIGKRIQVTSSPVWDTVLMTVALSDASISPDDEHVDRSLRWIKDHQLRDKDKGDWQVYNRGLIPGGFSIQDENKWYPDVDDTAIAIIAFVKHDSKSINSKCVADATEWILGMQNLDGGWGAYDSNNNSLYLNKIPFSDTNSLCDPSTADVTGHAIEAFGMLIHNEYVKAELQKRLTTAAERAINFITTIQESMGAWYGRWGSNYIYGTSCVMCGLGHFVQNNRSAQEMVPRAIEWIKSVQNVNGGWGEDFASYEDPKVAGRGVTTPSQSAWALMSLLMYLPPTDEAIQRGISFLVQTQTDKDGQAATWPQKLYTGTGFPLWLYMGYDLYAHYFPVSALGRYAQKMELQKLHRE
ncbi:hypothetical protein MMC29_003229 [Sticta canariensis]|nr:hypothetical protein [Sticta canariensis]